jgi:GNAT superfamily N-acetyltransferase
VIVRPSQPDEVDQVVRLWSESGRPAGATDDRAALTTLLERDPGSLIATWDGWRGNMYRLLVHPAHRHRGVALRLVEAGEAQAIFDWIEGWYNPAPLNSPYGTGW